jgi:hypothetical protein
MIPSRWSVIAILMFFTPAAQSIPMTRTLIDLIRSIRCTQVIFNDAAKKAVWLPPSSDG